MLNVAIVDDHTLVRAGLRDLLSDVPGIHVSFEAANGDAALARLADTPCDVLLLDIALPGQNGIDLLRHLRRHASTLPVLILSGYPEERYALPLMKNGADGYLCKTCAPEELVQALRTVAQGRRYVSPRTGELLAGDIAGQHASAPHESLSAREWQVFLRLARGDSVGSIGDALALSIKTVSTYRSRLLDKLGLNSNAELAAYAVRNGLLAD